MPFTNQFSASSPVLTLSSQPAHMTSMDVSSYMLQHAPHPFNRDPGLPRPAVSLAPGRKRSRDEASISVDSAENGQHGERMSPLSAQTGSGSSIADAVAERSHQLAQDGRPLLRTRKSRRMDRGPVEVPSQPLPAVSRPALADATMQSSGAISQAPIVDEFTLHLGIGWRRISDNEHIQAAARGWARYIENHYPLSNVHILLESSGLQSYLVEAAEGFFLFADHLRQGRLVSRTVQGALENLQRSPPTFDGTDTLVPADVPRSMEPQPITDMADAEMKMI